MSRVSAVGIGSLAARLAPCVLSAGLAACSKPAAPSEAKEERPLAENRNEAVTLNGVARNAKAGAVVVADDGRVVYLKGVGGWPLEIDGRRIAVTGVLREEKYIPDPVMGEAKAAGAYGDQLVLDEPRWTLAD